MNKSETFDFFTLGVINNKVYENCKNEFQMIKFFCSLILKMKSNEIL